jgi:acyl carrier protein
MSSPRSSVTVDQDRVRREAMEVIAEQMGRGAEELKPSDSLRDDLGCDSLDLVEISMLLEEQFEIEIPDDFAEEVDTIGQVADGVSRLLQQRPRE